MHRERKTYYVYIIGSLSGTLYIGMTSKLHARTFEHKFHRVEGFTDKYEVARLLYFLQHLPPPQLTRSILGRHDLGQLQRDPQATGGHRPHRGGLREAAEGGGAEFFGAVSVS